MWWKENHIKRNNLFLSADKLSFILPAAFPNEGGNRANLGELFKQNMQRPSSLKKESSADSMQTPATWHSANLLTNAVSV